MKKLFDYRYCNLGFDVGGRTWCFMLHFHLFDWRLAWFKEKDDDINIGFSFGPIYVDFVYNKNWKYPDD